MQQKLLFDDVTPELDEAVGKLRETLAVFICGDTTSSIVAGIPTSHPSRRVNTCPTASSVMGWLTTPPAPARSAPSTTTSPTLNSLVMATVLRKFVVAQMLWARSTTSGWLVEWSR